MGLFRYFKRKELRSVLSIRFVCLFVFGPVPGASSTLMHKIQNYVVG